MGTNESEKDIVTENVAKKRLVYVIKKLVYLKQKLFYLSEGSRYQIRGIGKIPNGL